MNPRKQAIFLMLQNNTTATIPVTILNQSSMANIANARTKYKWDITSSVYSPLIFSIEARFSSTAQYITYSGTLAAGNAQALIAGLNNLGIGAFWLETVGLSTFVVTYNDSIIYRNLTIGTATTTLTWNNTTVIAGGSLIIKVNTVTVVTSLNPGTFIPTIISGLLPGDAIDVNVVASPAENTPFLVSRTPVQPPFFSNVLYSTLVLGGASDSYSFVIDLAYTYNVNWGIPPP